MLGYDQYWLDKKVKLGLFVPQPEKAMKQPRMGKLRTGTDETETMPIGVKEISEDRIGTDDTETTS